MAGSEAKEGQPWQILFDCLQIGQTVSPQSAPATSLEVKNGVNCEHSPVDLSKVRRRGRLTSRPKVICSGAQGLPESFWGLVSSDGS